MHKVVCIGAGRLAHHLMPQLETVGCQVVQVYNRTASKALSLAGKLRDTTIVSRMEDIIPDADLYFLTLADDAILPFAEALNQLLDLKGIGIHCSGVSGLDLLPFRRRGIFYPLQTFSENHPVPWATTPILITSDKEEVQDILLSLAQKVSSTVYPMTDSQKSVLHLAAVFANNFTNHMLTLAERICSQHQVSFDILKPLIQETIEKALDSGPSNSQTGPAVRGDEKTLEKHLQLLADQPGLAEVYKVVTKSIIQNG